MCEITDFRTFYKKSLSKALKLFKNIFSLMGEMKTRLLKVRDNEKDCN